METEITDSLGNKYSVAHLKPFTTVFNIKLDDEPISVEMDVVFTNHCYTDSRKDHHTDADVLFKERRRHGIEERVFDLDRWEFSRELPGIIKSLHSKLCFLGGSKELFYRQENPPNPGSHAGWYLCIRMSANDSKQKLILSVRSAHHRINRPYEIRGSSKRFYAVLAQFYRQERKKRNWL